MLRHLLEGNFLVGVSQIRIALLYFYRGQRQYLTIHAQPEKFGSDSFMLRFLPDADFYLTPAPDAASAEKSGYKLVSCS
jgi:hypothetical protein